MRQEKASLSQGSTPILASPGCCSGRREEERRRGGGEGGEQESH